MSCGIAPVRRLFLPLLYFIFLISGCAVNQPGRTPDGTDSMRWSGRLSLVVSSSPAQSLSAGFELAGGPVSGTLVLSGPLGSRVATVRWGPEAAFLTSQGETRRFKTLDELTAELTGAALPINAVFEWLQGRAVPADHWEVDLSRLNDGRLTARRLQIEPKAELRLILEP